MIYAIAAALCIACAVLAWKVPAVRPYALTALGVVLALCGASAYGNALKDRGAAEKATRKELASKHKVQTARRNERTEGIQAASDAAVLSVADTEPSIPAVAPTDIEEREERLRALGSALD